MVPHAHTMHSFTVSASSCGVVSLPGTDGNRLVIYALRHLPTTALNKRQGRAACSLAVQGLPSTPKGLLVAELALWLLSIHRHASRIASKY